MDVRNLVRSYYPSGGLADGVLEVLAGAGIDTDHLAAHDLSCVDQVHAGGAAATALVLKRIELTADTRLLDVGCGLGVPSRMAADEYQAQVTGVDLPRSSSRLRMPWPPELGSRTAAGSWLREPRHFRTASMRLTRR